VLDPELFVLLFHFPQEIVERCFRTLRKPVYSPGLVNVYKREFEAEPAVAAPNETENGS
jgi:hypothetical protein